MIDNDASLLLRDASGKIPLFYAIENGLNEIVQMMILKNRDVIQVKDSITFDVPLTLLLCVEY
jgi:ankyrin repeat protein